MVFCICGMHRSGTSMITRLLNLCGMHLGGEDELMPPQTDNPEGFWENVNFVEINDRILSLLGGSWWAPPNQSSEWAETAALEPLANHAERLIARLKTHEFWGWKDPRNSLTLPFWRQLIPDLRIIVALRHPLEVAKSLYRRDKMPLLYALHLWYIYNTIIWNQWDDKYFFILNYDTALSHPEDSLRSVLRWAGLTAQEANIHKAAGIPNSTLRHHQHTDCGLTAHEHLRHVFSLYERLRSKAEMLFTYPKENASHRYVLNGSDKIQKTSSRPQHFHESCEANTLSKATRQAADRCISPQKLRMAVYSFDMPQHACARYRILASAERFSDVLEVRWGVLFQKDRIDVDLELGKWADLIIIQRFFPMAQTYGFIETLLATGKPVIYETDDHLLEIPESNPHKRRADESMPYILKCLSQATAVTVSTDELRKAFRPYHDHIYVLPNLLDDRLLSLPNSMKPSEGPVIIGYAGTPTHGRDLALLEDIFERLADKYGDRIAFRFMGCRTNRLEALPHSTFTPLSGYIDYVKNLRYSAIDIGLAPLADNTFNRCKSAVKWLEYSACGIAGVYSDLPPYRSAVQNGVSGILVSSTNPKSWTAALERLIENPDHRRSIGLAAQSQVFTRHTLKAHGRLFLNTWRWIAANKPSGSSKKLYVQPVPLANQEETHHDLSHFKLLPQIEHQTQKDSLTAPSVSIVIPTYNNHALTRTCLTSLYKTLADTPYEIICVDNASTDGTPHLLEAEASKKRICLIRNNQNLGFAKACNQGAFNSQGEFVVFLNNDTVVREGWLDAMIQCIKSSPDIGAVGSKLLYPEGTIQHAGVTFDSQAIPYHIYRFADADASYVNKERSFSAVTGACMLLRREAFLGIGGFDEAFQNGLEDVDLCLRIRKEGLRVRYAPQSVVCHYESVSPGRFTKARENYSYFFEKWGKDLPVAEDVAICTEDSTDIRRIRSFEKVWRAGNIHDRRKTVEYRKECEAPSTDIQSNHKIRGHFSTPLVSIIILSLNQVEWTKKSLQSVKKYTDVPYEIIVVDNGSEKESLQHLLDFAHTEDRIRIISNSKNRGFAAGNNQGLTIARGDYFLLLNNDTLVTPGWLQGLLDVFQRFPNTGIAGPMSNCVAGLQLIPSARYRDSEEMEAFAAYWRYMYRRQTIVVESVIGFCMLLRRAVVEAIGGLDEIFGKGNFEDNDFCLRARLKGFEVRIAKDVFIHHQGSLTFSSEKIDYSRAMKRNWELFKAKWGLPPHTQLGDAAVQIDPEKSARQYVQLPDLSATHSEDIPGKFWRERPSSQRSFPQRPCRAAVPVHQNHVTAKNH